VRSKLESTVWDTTPWDKPFCTEDNRQKNPEIVVEKVVKKKRSRNENQSVSFASSNT
jgi:hypothetical protein